MWRENPCLFAKMRCDVPWALYTSRQHMGSSARLVSGLHTGQVLEKRQRRTTAGSVSEKKSVLARIAARAWSVDVRD